MTEQTKPSLYSISGRPEGGSRPDSGGGGHHCIRGPQLEKIDEKLDDIGEKLGRVVSYTEAGHEKLLSDFIRLNLSVGQNGADPTDPLAATGLTKSVLKHDRDIMALKTRVDAIAPIVQEFDAWEEKTINQSQEQLQLRVHASEAECKKMAVALEKKDEQIKQLLWKAVVWLTSGGGLLLLVKQAWEMLQQGAGK